MAELVIALPWPGVANEVEWETDIESIGSLMSVVSLRVIRQPRPTPGGDLAPTYPRQQRLRHGDLLWPMTGQGERLRKLYVDHGDRALTDRPDWCGWRRDPDDYP